MTTHQRAGHDRRGGAEPGKQARCFAGHVLLAAALTLGACSLIPNPTVSVAYDLPAATQAPGTAQTSTAHATTSAWTLRISTPHATAPIHAQQIVVRKPNASLTSYQGIRWVDAAPILLRDRLVQTLDDSTRFAAVVSDHSLIDVDVELTSVLRAFELRLDTDAAYVRVQLDSQLLEARERHILASHAFATQVPLARIDDPDVVVAAFGHAVETLTQELAAWLAQQAIGNTL